MKVIEKIRQFFGPMKLGWSGDYKTWDDAASVCTNYTDHIILDKVREALIKVKDGRASFERDSVLFYKEDYNWPFLSSILWSFGQKNNKLTIVDFGGSLGSTYFQHRKWFKNYSYTWNVVEQVHFVEEGKNHFEDDFLKFFSTVDEVKTDRANFLVLSSVLPYLPDPYAWLMILLDKKFDYIFLDKTPLVSGVDRLTIQRVPKEIYDASYPSWFFNKEKFLQILKRDYEVMLEFDCVERAWFSSEFKGFFLTRKK